MAKKISEGIDIPDELHFDLIYYVNHIELFLNPIETITKKFIELKDKVSGYIVMIVMISV
jgi:hypothetical protein